MTGWKVALHSPQTATIHPPTLLSARWKGPEWPPEPLEGSSVCKWPRCSIASFIAPSFHQTRGGPPHQRLSCWEFCCDYDEEGEDYVVERWWRCHQHLTISATHRRRLKCHLKKKIFLHLLIQNKSFWAEGSEPWLRTFSTSFYWSLPNSAWTKALIYSLFCICWSNIQTTNTGLLLNECHDRWITNLSISSSITHTK